MEFTFSFIKLLFISVYLTAPLLLSLFLVIVVLGQIVGRLENWNRFEAFYWTFITATTVGYGDIKPARKRSRILTMVIIFMGLMLTGILVAISVNTASVAFGKHMDISQIERIVKEVKKQAASGKKFRPDMQAGPYFKPPFFKRAPELNTLHKQKQPSRKGENK